MANIPIRDIAASGTPAGSSYIVFDDGQMKKGLVSSLKGGIGLGNVDNTSDATKNAAVATLTNKTLTAPVLSTPTVGSPNVIGIMTLSGGQIAFPATQVPSSDPNTLDDYEEGTWTPVLTFATPGDLARTYSVQSGSYTKIGRAVFLGGQVTTSAFTHTTASGGVRITGVPFAYAAVSHGAVGSTAFRGITKASYTQFGSFLENGNNYITFYGFASAQVISQVTAADMPTGGTVQLTTSIQYQV